MADANSKRCANCGQVKPLTQFVKDRKAKDGAGCYCKPCNSERALAWNRANPAKSRANRDGWIERNPQENTASKAKYRAANAEKVKRSALTYYASNAAKVRACNEAWRQANPGAWAVYTANRRAAKLRACPPWADRNAIRQFYVQASKLGLTVDHIVPLKNKAVCGLHIVANMQMLTKQENCRKHNRLC